MIKIIRVITCVSRIWIYWMYPDPSKTVRCIRIYLNWSDYLDLFRCIWIGRIYPSDKVKCIRIFQIYLGQMYPDLPDISRSIWFWRRSDVSGYMQMIINQWSDLSGSARCIRNHLNISGYIQILIFQSLHLYKCNHCQMYSNPSEYLGRIYPDVSGCIQILINQSLHLYKYNHRQMYPMYPNPHHPDPILHHLPQGSHHVLVVIWLYHPLIKFEVWMKS